MNSTADDWRNGVRETHKVANEQTRFDTNTKQTQKQTNEVTHSDDDAESSNTWKNFNIVIELNFDNACKVWVCVYNWVEPFNTVW